MKFTIRTLAVVAPIGLGACLLLTLVGTSQDARSQERANPNRIPDYRPIRPNLPILRQPAVVNQPVVAPQVLMTPEQRIEKRIADLEAKVVEQQKTIDALSQQVNAKPAGYAKAFINMGGFKRLPDSEGVTYWARIKN